MTNEVTPLNFIAETFFGCFYLTLKQVLRNLSLVEDKECWLSSHLQDLSQINIFCWRVFTIILF